MEHPFGDYFERLGVEPKAASLESGEFDDYLKNLSDKQIAPAQDDKIACCDDVPAHKPFDTVIVGGQLVMPEYGVVRGDLYVQDGKVAAVTFAGADLPAKQTISADGCYVLPGIIDPHVHLGIMTPMREELDTETSAALIGGITTAGMFVSSPDARIGAFEKLADDIHSFSHINIRPHFVIADEEQISQLPQIIEQYGIRSFKCYLHGVPGIIESKHDAFIVRVMQALKESGKDCVLCIHSENHSLVNQATDDLMAKTGSSATLHDWEQSHPELAEEEAIHRISFFAKKFQQKVYVVHASSQSAAEMLREVKKDNPYIIGETTSPYLTLSLDDGLDYRAKMEPPIRGRRHQEALWKALKDDVIDTIGTDNVMVPAPVKEKNKNDLWKVPSGYAVLETHLPSVLNEGVLRRGVPIQQIISKMTMNPAKAFGIYPRKGSLQPGSDADIVIVDLNSFMQVQAENLNSASGISIFEGRQIAGWPRMTILGGVVVAENRKIASGAMGKLVL